MQLKAHYFSNHINVIFIVLRCYFNRTLVCNCNTGIIMVLQVFTIVVNEEDTCLFVYFVGNVKKLFFLLFLHKYRNEDQSSSLLRSEQLPSVPETGGSVVVPSRPFSKDKSADMTGASKELSPEKVSNTQFVDARPIDEGIIASVYSFAKKAATVGRTIKYF